VQRLQGRIVLRQAASDKAEAEYVVHQIERLLGGTSAFSADSGRVESHAEAQCTFGDIAVLHRVAAQRAALVEALERSGVPFRVGSEEPHEGYERSAEHVAVLTMHAAKGLEFQVVFVVGCEEGLLPLHLGSRQADVEEERRLFYVAMSRARQALFLTGCAARFLQGCRLPGRPSRFLAAIEQRLLEQDHSSSGRRRSSRAVPGNGAQLSLFASV
jgi:DNA helicase-2/ATP-dependent DNA helicase PcrA